VADYSGPLRQLVEKMLMHRGRRRATCRVFPPTNGPYSVIIDEAGVREQFSIDQHHVAKFGETGNDQFVLNDIRNGVRNFDRMMTKKKAGRSR
jgi:hypothetical protein